MTKKRPERKSRPSRRPSNPRGGKGRVPRTRPSRSRSSRVDTGTNWKLIGGGAVIVLLLFVLGFFGIRALRNEDDVADVTAIAPTSPPINNPTNTPDTATATTIAAAPAATAMVTPTISSSPIFVPPDIPALQQYMQSLINADRASNGQSELGWDETAAAAGMLHAQEMSAFSYLSHWNLNGYGPDYRYTKAGGLDTDSENVYFYQHTPDSDLTPTSAEDWQALIRDAEKALMESPGHQANILAPEHTDVGIGIAYDEGNGRLSIAQEFTNHYVVIQPLPLQTAVGGEITMQGRLLPGVTNPLINLAFEPYPLSMGTDELNNTSTYESAAKNYDVINVILNADGTFKQPFVLNHDEQPGLYHIRLWVDTDSGETLAVDVVVEVR